MSSERGQRSKECDVIGCQEKGRILAKLGTINIAYCPKHRKKYGERIINALLNSCFNYKLTTFLSGVKKDIFMSDLLSVDSAKKVKAYILSRTTELENILKYAEENEIDNSVGEPK